MIVISLPTQETRHRIQDIFLSSPVSIDFARMYVPLSLKGPLPASGVNLQNIGPFTAKFVEFRSKFGQNEDDNTENELVGVLESEDRKMEQLASMLGVPEGFEIRLVFRKPAPSHSTTVRNFLVSISEILCFKEPAPFTFTAPIVYDGELENAPHSHY